VTERPFPALRAGASNRLRDVLRDVFFPDPFTDEIDGWIVEAAALSVELVAEVSRRRDRDAADNPCKRRPAVHHLEHAVVHTDVAHHAEAEDDAACEIDPDTGLPHIGHALARLMFAYALQLETKP
jgi:hypothetical protein